MVSAGPDAYLRGKKEAAATPQRAELWTEIEDLYARKLWHPLTLKLKELVNDERFVSDEGAQLIDLYDKFISDFQSRLNPLELALICRPIALAVKHDRERARKFLGEISKTVKSSGRAKAFVTTCMAEVDLHSKDAKGACNLMQEVKDTLDEAEQLLEEVVGVSAAVHGYYYKVSAEYLRQLGDYAAYYRDALRYLGCTPMESIPEAELKLYAVCLAGAALLGKNIYNFGELLAHPIVEILRSAPSEKWVADLLFAFNKGDLRTFEQLRPKWSAWADLAANEAALLEKIRLLAVMEMAYIRGSGSRQIPFSEISQTTGVPLNEVEFLLMKAQSRGLIKGRINAVKGSIRVDWVLPRVLDRDQVRQVAGRLSEWARSVRRMHKIVSGCADLPADYGNAAGSPFMRMAHGAAKAADG